MFKVGDTLISNKGNEQFYILSVTPFNNTFYYVGHFLKPRDIQEGYVFSQKYLKENYKLKPQEKWGVFLHKTPSQKEHLLISVFESKKEAEDSINDCIKLTYPYTIFKIPEDAL